jgi:hypothetical protein
MIWEVQMQEGAVGWDPLYIDHQMPVIPKLFVLYLFATLIILIARSLKLGWRLGWFSNFRHSTLDQIAQRIHEQDLDSASALAAKLPSIIPEAGLRNWSSPPGKDQNTTIQALRRAEDKFTYSWEHCIASVDAMRRTSNSIINLAVFVFLTGFGNLFRQLSMVKYFGLGEVAGYTSEILVVQAIAFFVCSLVYAASSVFEKKLMRRRTRWNYFYSCTSADLSTQT